MNIYEIERELVKEGVNGRSYSFIGPQGGEKYCLVQSGGVWEAYYAERGEKSSLKLFNDESKACEYFLEWILKDPSVRLPVKRSV